MVNNGLVEDLSPDQALPSGADYLRQVLRAPVYEVATVTPLQAMPRLSGRRPAAPCRGS